MDSINMANQGPLIKLNQTYFEVYRNKPFYLNASGFDIDGNITHFIVLANVNYTETQHEQSTAIHNATSSFRFIVTDLIPVTIGITAVDDKNLQSEVFPLSLTLCTGCSNQGSCNFSVTRPTSSPYFSYATCNCNSGHRGAECAEVSDGCALNSCPLGCVNITNNLEQENGIFYNCVKCPVGFNLSIAKTKCEDLDECQTSPCDSFADCENTFGSFVCHCPRGYQNINNTCVDIDECANKLDNCDQICINMPGKFNCPCFSGYKRANNTCVGIKTDTNQCKSLNKTCEHGCNGTQGCFCKRGYNLTQDGIHCEGN
ncbi:fibrillin-2-like [Physella acuta]|uniref:fibrillin-2-like n=1 Tax=Physella acuta TaxID=109671 RepID=UPI0027DAFD6B|nr:fibrillin-2-like [Physella acuta]